jgi:hypothetical protein
MQRLLRNRLRQDGRDGVLGHAPAGRDGLGYSAAMSQVKPWRLAMKSIRVLGLVGFTMTGLLWIWALWLPAISIDQESLKGWHLFVLGFASLLNPVIALAYASVASWYANVLLALVVYFSFTSRPIFATVFAVLGLCVSLLILATDIIPFGPEFADVSFTLRSGCLAWIASMVFALLSSLCRLASLRSPMALPFH